MYGVTFLNLLSDVTVTLHERTESLHYVWVIVLSQ